MSTHEQDCPCFPDLEHKECACDVARAAYARGVARSRERAQEAHLAGFHDGYERGREDAAAAVETLRDPSIAIPTIAMAVEAARGGSHE